MKIWAIRVMANLSTVLLHHQNKAAIMFL